MIKKKKIILTDEPHPYLITRLEQLGLECLAHYHTPREEVLRLLPDCYGMMVRSRLQVDQELLDAGHQLKFIARYGVGTEHIDLAYAAKLGIPVFTSPEGSRDTVAEHSLGMLLMLMNFLGRADREVRNNEWRRAPNRGVEIKGKTVGILGYGNMGKALAQRLQGFEASVITYDKYKKDYGDRFAQQVTLEELQARADIISLHIPYEKDNHYFVDTDFIAACTKPFYLVNTARGLVVNTADVVAGLKSGQLKGAALDVLEYEEMSFSKLELSSLPAPFQYLKQAGNVVLSPHIAGWSFESKLGHAQTLAQKIEQLMKASVSQ